MQLHELKTIHKQKNKKRVGRGGKRGTYSGHGLKGQRSRAGKNFKPIIRDLIKRYPKLRGYKAKKRESKTVVLNIADLEKSFSASGIVNPKELLKMGLVRRINGKTPKVKILAVGEIKKALRYIIAKSLKKRKKK